MLEVVSEVCGVHAQVQSSAELQIWARVEGVKPKDVQEALWERRALVRTWAMRGTLHLTTADDLPSYVGALRQHDRWWKGAWLRYVGLSERELRKVLADVHEALGARPMTRQQLADKVGGKARERLLSNWGELLKPAAFSGSLISGPPRGQNVTFVRPDRWLKGWRDVEDDEAWREVIRRYLATYGPATREDFARWWGMQPAPAGRVLKAMPEGELEEVDVEGTRAWALAGDVKAMRRSSSKLPIRLLPGFDVFVVGNRPKQALVERKFEARVFRQAGWVSPVVLIEGMAAGVWRHEKQARTVEVTVEPFAKLPSARKKAIAEEAARLGKFLGAPVRVEYA
jgi:hypothetical protein